MFGRYIFPKYVIDTRIIKIKLREPRKQRLEYDGNIHKSESLLSDSWQKKRTLTTLAKCQNLIVSILIYKSKQNLDYRVASLKLYLVVIRIIVS